MILKFNDPANPTGDQWGIYNEYNYGDTLKRNQINGDAASKSNLNSRGIWEEGGSGSQLFCNNVATVGKAFEFTDCNYNLTWQGNTMNDYQRGLDLNSGGIGQQGSSTAASDNTWAGLKWDTYVEGGANPASSKLYVQTGTPYQPTYNGGGMPYTSSTIITGNPAGANACSLPKALPSGVASITAANQSYELFPNPGNGNVVIKQSQSDDQVNVQIMSADGRIVYKGTLQFTDLQAKLDMTNMASGVYLVQLQDTHGNTFNQKYVLNN
jgi:hypothetical protein